jgi:hypothetical protein
VPSLYAAPVFLMLYRNALWVNRKVSDTKPSAAFNAMASSTPMVAPAAQMLYAWPDVMAFTVPSPSGAVYSTVAANVLAFSPACRPASLTCRSTRSNWLSSMRSLPMRKLHVYMLQPMKTQ